MNIVYVAGCKYSWRGGYFEYLNEVRVFQNGVEITDQVNAEMAQARRIAELKEKVAVAAIARRTAEADYDRFFAGSIGEDMTATEATEFNEISERVKPAKRQFDIAVDALMEAQKENKPVPRP